MEEHLRLQRLSDSDSFEVASGDPDIRGWHVVDDQHEILGEVDDLIVDPSAMKVRYLEIDLEDGSSATGDHRRVVVPVDAARIDTGDKQVYLQGMSRAAIASMPNIDEIQSGRSFNDAREHHSQRGDGQPQRLYRSAEELHVGKRVAQAGEVRVGKRVETERVSEPVTTFRERVTIERRPVEGKAPSDARIDASGNIVVPIFEEEPVVEKRVVAKEELVIGKEREEHTENVEADLRREEFDIDRQGDVRVEDGSSRVKR